MVKEFIAGEHFCICCVYNFTFNMGFLSHHSSEDIYGQQNLFQARLFPKKFNCLWLTFFYLLNEK